MLPGREDGSVSILRAAGKEQSLANWEVPGHWISTEDIAEVWEWIHGQGKTDRDERHLRAA
jgi:hypothetical protein